MIDLKINFNLIIADNNNYNNKIINNVLTNYHKILHNQ